MTLCVGFNFGRYALLFADTRVSYADATYTDDADKIQETDIGIITGAGLVNLLDPVKERLAAIPVCHTDDIVKIIKDERERVRGMRWTHPEVVERSLETTSWMFTYLGGKPYDPAEMTAERLKEYSLRLVIPRPDFDDKFEHIRVNDCGILPPAGTTQEQYETWLQTCRELMKPLADDVRDLAEHAGQHLRIAIELLEVVAESYDGVSKSFQFALHVYPSAIYISDIMNNIDELKWLVTPSDNRQDDTVRDDGR